MKTGLIALAFVVFFSFSVARAEEHTKEYQEWRENTLDKINIANRSLQVKNSIIKLAKEFETKFGSNPCDVKVVADYVVWLHEKFLISKRDCDLSKI